MNAETGGYHKEVTIVQAADGEACGGTRVSPFDRPEWFALLAESRPGAFTASATQDDATVSMPLNRADGRLEALRNWYSFTWRPLVPHEATGEIGYYPVYELIRSRHDDLCELELAGGERIVCSRNHRF